MITEPLFWLAAVPAVILVGLAKGGFAGLVMPGMALLALVVSPLRAAAIMLPVLLVQDMISLWAYRSHADRRALAILLPGAAIGIALAAWGARSVPDDAVRLLVGIVALAFVANQVWSLARKAAEGAQPGKVPAGLFWGALSGFASFVSHSGGPPFQVWVLPQRMDKERLAATSTWFFAVVNLAKVGPYAWLGQFDAANLATSVALLPLAVVAALAGVWAVRQIDGALFYRLIYALMTAVGLRLVWSGLAGLGWM